MSCYFHICRALSLFIQLTLSVSNIHAGFPYLWGDPFGRVHTQPQLSISIEVGNHQRKRSEKGRQNLVWGERGLWMGGWLNRIVSKDILVKSAQEGFLRVRKYGWPLVSCPIGRNLEEVFVVVVMLLLLYAILSLDVTHLLDLLLHWIVKTRVKNYTANVFLLNLINCSNFNLAQKFLNCKLSPVNFPVSGHWCFCGRKGFCSGGQDPPTSN